MCSFHHVLPSATHTVRMNILYKGLHISLTITVIYYFNSFNQRITSFATSAQITLLFCDGISLGERLLQQQFIFSRLKKITSKGHVAMSKIALSYSFRVERNETRTCLSRENVPSQVYAFCRHVFEILKDADSRRVRHFISLDSNMHNLHKYKSVIVLFTSSMDTSSFYDCHIQDTFKFFRKLSKIFWKCNEMRRRVILRVTSFTFTTNIMFIILEKPCGHQVVS